MHLDNGHHEISRDRDYLRGGKPWPHPDPQALAAESLQYIEHPKGLAVEADKPQS